MNGAESVGYPCGKKMNLDPLFTSYTKKSNLGVFSFPDYTDKSDKMRNKN